LVNGELQGRLYSNGKPVRVCWEGGVIERVEETARAPETELWIAPALLDLQINGFAGVDFQQPQLSEAELVIAARGLQEAGCGRFLVTLVSAEWPKMLTQLRRLRALRDGSPQLQAAIAGWHVEGPFLSAEPGFCGAHDAAVMRDPSLEAMHDLREATGNDPVLLTLAPERAQSIEAIRQAVSLGFKVSLGHTNASAAVLASAVRAGATGFTHLANACPQQLDRHDNIVWRVLDTPGLIVSLIPDKIHVAPSLFRLVHRVLGPESIYYTTDAISPAGAPPGRYPVGRLEVEVGADRVARVPGGSHYAGSALTPIEGIFCAAEMLRRPWQEVWDLLSMQPARFMGFEHGLGEGRLADLCLLRVSEQGKLEELRTWRRGQERGESFNVGGESTRCAES
jgi:N-acetylglucosamine-6-phosphate deacetylase